MTTALDAVLGPLAEKFIDKFGTSVRYTSKALASYDTATGDLSEGVKSAEVKCVIENSRRQPTDAGGSDINRSITVAASTLPVAPSEGDTVKFGKVVYVVADIEENYSGDEVATYTLGLRK